MAILLLSFKTKHHSRTIIANSFRLHEIKQMLSQYGDEVFYDIDEKENTAHVYLSETISEEKDKEISSILVKYFDRNFNQVDTYLDIIKEMAYTNGEG